MLLPIKSKNPPESFPYATVSLIVINVLVYAFTSESGLTVREDVVDQWALKAMDFPSVTLLTSCFLHGDYMHLLSNMWFLYLFGFAVEGRLRSVRFLLLYLTAALGGDVCHYLLVGINNPTQPALGASGAIMGVLGAALFAFPFARVNVFYWFYVSYAGVAEWMMWWVGLYFLGIDGLMVLIGADTGVAYFAHLGGAAAGFLTAMVLRMKRDDESASDAKATLSEFNDVFALPSSDAKEIALANPGNADACLAWALSCLRKGAQPPEESLALLDKHIPFLVRNGPVCELGDVMAAYGGRAGRYHPRYLVDVALRAERDAEPHRAAKLLEAALNNPHLEKSDRETALYQLAMINEMWFKNYHSAAQFYRLVYDEFPGSPLADQAMARFKIVSPLAQKTY